MLTDIDAQKPEEYPWHTVGPAELGAAAGEIATECREALQWRRQQPTLDEANVILALLTGLRKSLAILARHARPAQEK